MPCRTCGPRRKRWDIRSRSCERLEELALIGAFMSSQEPSAVDLLVATEVSRVSGGDERCPVAQAVKFAEIEKSLRELRSGRMIVIADDEDRENEGDLMIAAEMVTPEVINFMATYARGLICLAMTGERLRRLELGLMGPHKHREPWHSVSRLNRCARKGCNNRNLVVRSCANHLGCGRPPNSP